MPKSSNGYKSTDYASALNILSGDKEFVPADTNALPVGTHPVSADILFLPPDQITVSEATLSLPAGTFDLSGDITGLPDDSRKLAAG
jgi:hypothetical protein